DVGSTRTFRSGFRAAQARQLGAIGGQFEPERTDKEGERGWSTPGGRGKGRRGVSGLPEARSRS
ncbi:unnamed protein product, partial [Ascophyllum nodosum]